MEAQQDGRERHTVLIRTSFDAPAVWNGIVAAVASSGPGGLGPPVDIVDNQSFNGLSWQQVVLLLAHDGRPTVLFIADATTMVSSTHALMVVDGTDEQEPFRCSPAAVWDIEANLDSDNLSFAELADEARRLGGLLTARSLASDSGTASAVPPEHSFARRSIPRRSRPRTVDSLIKGADVVVPSAVGIRVRELAARREVSIEELIHEAVLDDARASDFPPSPNVKTGDTVTLTVRFSSVLSVLLTGTARANGFLTVEDYCAALLQAIAEDD